MMDEMKINLGSKMMRGIVSKLIAKAVYKKTGCKVDIQLNDLLVWVIDGDTNIKLNVEAKCKSDEFNKILKKLDLD